MEARLLVVYLLVSCVSAANLQVGPLADNSTKDIQMLGTTRTDLYYMNQYCNHKIPIGKAVRVAPWNSRYPSEYSNCLVYLFTPSFSSDIVITFNSMDMSSKSGGICFHSKLEMFDGYGTSYRISDAGGICGDRPGRSQYTTNGDKLTMEFTTKQLSPHTAEYFEAVITAYHTGACTSNEFKCKNGRCIDKGLFCDSYNNCGDDSDEDGCAAVVLSIAAIVGIVLGGIVILGIITAVVVCRCCCRMLTYERF